MTETIRRETYDDRVDSMASIAAGIARDLVEEGRADSKSEAKFDAVDDILDAHDWFSKPRFAGAAHGAIVEHATDRGVDPHRYSDWWSLAESDDMETVVKRLAYYAIQADVLSSAEDILTDA